MILQTIEARIILALALALGGVSLFAYSEHATIKARDADIAQLKPAADVAEEYRKDLAQCEADKQVMRQQVHDAQQLAVDIATQAGKSNETFQQKLETAKGCDAILQAQVCPKLMDY